MNEQTRSSRDVELAWNPGPYAVWQQDWTDPGEESISLVLQHPADPYQAMLPTGVLEDEVQRFAGGYLSRLLERGYAQKLPEPWLAALSTGDRENGFGWIPLAYRDAADPSAAQPFGSFIDPLSENSELFALFAAERVGDFFYGSGYGLRIAIRLRRLDGGVVEASVAGLSASIPKQPDALFDPQTRIDVHGYFSTLVSARALADLARVAGSRDLTLRGLRFARTADALVTEWHVIAYMAAPGDDVSGDGPARVTPYAVTIRSVPKARAEDPDVLPVVIHRSAFVADANGHARVFVRDPGSQGRSATLGDRRPSRDATLLDPDRVVEPIIGTRTGPLEDVGHVTVESCHRFVPEDPVAGGAKIVTLDGSGPPVRSNDASAVQAFHHVRDLYRRLTQYGLPPATYFKTAKQQVSVFYRSGIVPGPGKDGRTVNAQVQPDGWPRGAVVGPQPSVGLPKINIHLALADLKRGARAPWVPGGPPSPAEPLGIAADPRWMWHEFGHVLLMATTGELELRFAHSPGDALAAIVCDPESTLRPEALRFATFPWVSLPRRHDRCCADGWGWNGPFHAELAQVPDALQPRRKGYASEQILSSSLFRLYRCLGGDTEWPAGAGSLFERRRASHYTVYLVMRALSLLGDARIAITRRPEQLVQALIDADRLVDAWAATLTEQGHPVAYARTGGCAHKAIRWAFEAQGMYAAPGGDATGPGEPPLVDVYIESRRHEAVAPPPGDLPYEAGNYAPVSLHWHGSGGAEPPPWQAHADAMKIVGTDLFVNVGNRGQNPADHVQVRVWRMDWDPTQATPTWPGPGWKTVLPAAAAAQTIAPGDTESFGPFDLSTVAGSCLLLAEATCLDDRGNIDAGLVRAATIPVADLVSADNNLGLRYVV